jgi:hypothetical protein
MPSKLKSKDMIDKELINDSKVQGRSHKEYIVVYVPCVLHSREYKL